MSRERKIILIALLAALLGGVGFVLLEELIDGDIEQTAQLEPTIAATSPITSLPPTPTAESIGPAQHIGEETLTGESTLDEDPIAELNESNANVNLPTNDYSITTEEYYLTAEELQRYSPPISAIEDVRFSNEQYEAVFSTLNGAIISLKLKKFEDCPFVTELGEEQPVEEECIPPDLVYHQYNIETNQYEDDVSIFMPLTITFTQADYSLENAGALPLIFDYEKNGNTIQFQNVFAFGPNKVPLQITKTIVLPNDSYMIDVSLELKYLNREQAITYFQTKFKKKYAMDSLSEDLSRALAKRYIQSYFLFPSELVLQSPADEQAGFYIYYGPSLGTFPHQQSPTERSRYDYWYTHFYYQDPLSGETQFYEEVSDITDDYITPRSIAPPSADSIYWVAIKNRYFLAAMIPEKNGIFIKGDVYAEEVIGEQEINYIERNKEMVGLVGPRTVLSQGESIQANLSLYAGPLSRKHIVDYDIGLEKAAESTWTIIAVLQIALEWLLFWINSWVGNFGITIILLTILLKILLFPLSHTSMQSMKKMQELGPRIQEINNKFKDDPQKKQAAMMDLYKKEKINPLGGCIPLLLQIPVFIALWRVLPFIIELKNQNFLWINDLSSPDTVLSWSSLMGKGGVWEYLPTGLNILPLIMVVTSFLQQKFTPQTPQVSEQAATQQKIMKWMPLLFLFIFYSMPSGLVLYWTVQNFLQIIQQLITNKIKERKQ